MPCWDTVDITAATLQHDFKYTINVGQEFPKRLIRGTVRFRNTTNQNVKMTDVIASCSCTSATREDHEIRPGDSHRMLLTVMKDKVGPFDVGVSLRLNGFVNHMTLKGRVRPRIEALTPRLDFDEQGRGSIVFRVHEPNTSSDLISLRVTEGDVEIQSVQAADNLLNVVVTRQQNELPAATMTVVPLVNGSEWEPMSIRMRHQGLLVSVPNTVYIARSSPTIRLFVRGDIEGLLPSEKSGQRELAFQSDRQSTSSNNVKSTLEMLKIDETIVSITGDNSFRTWETGTHRVSVTVNKLSYVFQLQLRD